ncbi:MAG: LysR family transcriptional regulator [Pseudomonadota bacterium]
MLSNWDDLRCLLAVADAGSLTAAARRLESSQPTLGRRMRALEASLDAPLLHRSHDRLTLTPLGETIVEIVRGMQSAVDDIERHAAGAAPAPAGLVRIATTECIASSWLVRQLPTLAARYPDVEVEILTGISMADIVRRDADIAIRVGLAGPDNLECLHIGSVEFGLYAGAEYLRRNPAPASLDELSEHTGFDSLRDLSGLPQVVEFRRLAADSAFGFDSVLTQAAAARRGLGIVPLPKYVCVDDPGIERLLADEFALQRDLWLLTHPDLLRTPRYDVVWRFLQDALTRDSDVFA